MNWLPLHSWHPVIVHLSLVGFELAVLFDLLALVTRSARWRDAATLLWLIGFVGAALALATGFLAYNRVEHSELAHEAMKLHRNLALGTLVVLIAAGIWRWRRPFSRPAFAAGLLGAIALVIVGYVGGELVYRHAIRIPTETLEKVTQERGSEEHHHSGTPAEANHHEHDEP